MEENWKDYYHKGLAAFFTIAMCILFFFGLLRFNEIKTYLGLIVGILRPFAFGAVIAYLLCPLCNLIERHLAKYLKLDGTGKWEERSAKKIKRFLGSVSIFLSLILFCLVIYILVAMVGTQVVRSVQDLITAMPGYIQKTSLWLEELVADNTFILKHVEQYSTDIMLNVQEFAKDHILPNINNITNGVFVSLWTMVSAVKDLAIGLIVAIYLMNSRRLFSRQAKLVVHAVFPQKEHLPDRKEQTADWILRQAGILNDYLGGFIKGKLLDSLIIGLICMVVTGIMEMPYAALVSVVIGVTNIIPFFGPFIGAIPTALLILVVSPIKCIYFIIFILILQQFDGNILGPKILGNSTNLSSFWVLFAILLFGGLFGIVGMVLGVPVFAFLYQLVKEWVEARLDKQREKKEEQQQATATE